jgi:hypothetical protein
MLLDALNDVGLPRHRPAACPQRSMHHDQGPHAAGVAVADGEGAAPAESFLGLAVADLDVIRYEPGGRIGANRAY